MTKRVSRESIVRPRQLARTGSRSLVGLPREAREPSSVSGTTDRFGRLQGNDLLYFSLLELPRLTLGWQYLHGKTVLEGGARGGAVLTGLYDPSEAGRRKLNGFEWGGFVSAQAESIKLDASFMRIEARKTLNGTPVDIGRAELCVVGGAVGLCIDGMLFRGDAELRASAPGTIHSTSSQYVGLTLGLAGW
jgi:hypothetical protein